MQPDAAKAVSIASICFRVLDGGSMALVSKRLANPSCEYIHFIGYLMAARVSGYRHYDIIFVEICSESD